MTTTVTTNKGTSEVTISDCWIPDGKRKHQVTTEQYQQMVSEWDGKDMVRAFSIISGIPYKTVFNTKDPDLENALIECTRFLYEDLVKFESLPIPNELNIEGKTIPIPKDPGHLSIGQNIHVREQLDQVHKYEELISFVCSIYLQPAYDETEFDFFKATELHEKILKLPIVDTYPLGIFFLSHLMPSGQSIISRLSLMLVRLRQSFMRKEPI